MRSARLFAAIDLPIVVGNSLRALDPRLHGLRFLPPEQIHLTLAFFGAVTEEKAASLRERLKVISFGFFFLPVAGVACFYRRSDAVVWIGVGRAHPHLFQLRKRVAEAALACQLPIDERAWNPHFTIARARGVAKAQLEALIKPHRTLEAGLIPVNAFTLYQSEPTGGGPIYRDQLTVRARDAAADNCAELISGNGRGH